MAWNGDGDEGYERAPRTTSPDDECLGTPPGPASRPTVPSAHRARWSNRAGERRPFLSRAHAAHPQPGANPSW